MPATPGRRAGGKYLPFNPRAKDVGTITGRPMPNNVPRNSAGFEDPDAFFKSPPTTVGRKGKTPARTPGRPSESPKGPGKTPRAGAATVTPARRGRMSQLAADEDEEEFADDLLADENDMDDVGTSGPFFGDSLNLPRRSALPPPSPSVDYDHLPSPSKRRPGPRAAASAATPRTSRASHALADVTTDGFIDDEAGGGEYEDEDEDEEDDGEGDTSARTANRSKARRMTAVSAISAEGGRDGNTSRRSLAAPADDFDDDAGDFDDDGGYAQDTFDDFGDAGMEDGDRTLDPIEEEDDDDVPVVRTKRTAVVEEEVRPISKKKNGRVQHDEDEDEDEAVPAKKKAKAAAKPVKKAAPRREPGDKAERTTSQVKRSRASGIAVDPEDYQYDGDFTCRRSGRRHFAPLAFWRNEKFEYAKGDAVPEIIEVVHVAPEPVRPLGKAGKRMARAARSIVRGRSGSRARSESYHPQEEGWDEKTNAFGLVKEWPSGKEVNRRIAMPKSQLRPKEVVGSEFLYQKVFGEDVFVASGMVHIPVGGSKPGKPSKDNTYMFYVAKGAVQVIIHKTSFVMAVGGQFMVPRGNHYSIENISPTATAELFFAQARKIRAHEDDAAMSQGRPSVAPSDVPVDA